MKKTNHLHNVKNEPNSQIANAFGLTNSENIVVPQQLKNSQASLQVQEVYAIGTIDQSGIEIPTGQDKHKLFDSHDSDIHADLSILKTMSQEHGTSRTVYHSPMSPKNPSSLELGNTILKQRITSLETEMYIIKHKLSEIDRFQSFSQNTLSLLDDMQQSLAIFFNSAKQIIRTNNAVQPNEEPTTRFINPAKTSPHILAFSKRESDGKTKKYELSSRSNINATQISGANKASVYTFSTKSPETPSHIERLTPRPNPVLAKSPTKSYRQTTHLKARNIHLEHPSSTSPSNYSYKSPGSLKKTTSVRDLKSDLKLDHIVYKDGL